MRIWIITLILVVITGCVNTSKKMDERMSVWKGRDVNDLIAAWGPPESIMSDRKGGEIYIYDESSTTTIPGYSTSTSSYRQKSDRQYGTIRTTTTHNPPETFEVDRKRMFWIGSDGKIYRWSWKGL